MKNSVIKTINQFKDNLFKASELAVKEVVCTSYSVEIESITFNIDYSGASDSYEVYDCTVVINYGDPSGEPWYRGNSISINNIPEYKLEDINYLYGLFYGYFSMVEQSEE